MGAFDDLNGSGGAFADLAPKKPISRKEKLIRGVTDPIEGAAQLLTHMLPDSVVEGGNELNNWLAKNTGLVAKIPERNLSSLINGEKTGFDALVSNNEREYQARRSAAGESGFDGWRMAGNVISPANLALASRLPVAASLSGRVGTGMVGGGVSAAMNPVTDGDFATEKAKQIGLGVAFGGAVPAVTGAAARMISPNASKNQQLNLLRAQGVKPTVGQSLGGWANTVEEKMQSLPVVGDAIAYARGRAREQFNNAAINRAVAPIGKKVEGSGAEAIAKAHDLLSDAYTRGKAALGHFTVDGTARTELQTLKQMANSLQPKERRIFQHLWDTVDSEITPNGSVLADGFKRIDSKLGGEAAKFSGASDVYQQKLGEALKEFQRIIVDNAKRGNPQAAKLIKDADKGWANLVRIEGASVGAKNSGGVFTPGQLMTAVRGADKSVRDNATAQGKALMQDLAGAGQSVLGNKVSDSGTAGRLAMGGASFFIDPTITAGLLGGAAAYSPPAQALLRGLVSARPQLAQPAANVFRQAAPALIPGGAQLGLGLLQ